MVNRPNLILHDESLVSAPAAVGKKNHVHPSRIVDESFIKSEQPVIKKPIPMDEIKQVVELVQRGLPRKKYGRGGSSAVNDLRI